MKCLIIYAHQEKKSFNSAMKNIALKTLQRQGHEVILSDLYAMKFKPTTDLADFEHLKNNTCENPDLANIKDSCDDEYYFNYALEQRKAYPQNSLSPDIQEELEKLIWCDYVIFQFPLYWFSMPAILKGWMDRVFICGYVYGGKRFYDQGALRGKKAMLSVTVGSRENMFGPNGIHGDMMSLLEPVHRGLAYTGFGILPPYIAYHVPYISQVEREAYLYAYQQRLLTIEATQSLKYPKINDYNEHYQLKSNLSGY